MKKQETITVRYCDNCKKKLPQNEIKFECEGCKKDFCEKCIDKKGNIYLKDTGYTQSSIYVVCNKCDHNPPNEKVKAFVTFFKDIAKLGEAEGQRKKEYDKMIIKYRKDNMPKG